MRTLYRLFLRKMKNSKNSKADRIYVALRFEIRIVLKNEDGVCNTFLIVERAAELYFCLVLLLPSTDYS